MILPTKGKSLEGQGGDFIDVRLDELSRITLMIFPNKSIGIGGTDFLCINILEPLEGVDSDDNVSSTSVRVVIQVALFQVVQNRGLCFIFEIKDEVTNELVDRNRKQQFAGQ